MHTQNEISGTSTPTTVIGLSLFQEHRLRFQLRELAPSEPWVDVQFIEVPQTDSQGELIIRRFHDPSPFPPGGADTAMIRCPICGVFTPPPALEAGVCLDHRDHADWGPSPSAEAIRAIQYRNLAFVEMELRPESEEALRRAIQNYELKRNRRKSRAHRGKKKRKSRWISIE